MSERQVALGLMSGTSVDAIDVALIETDGEDWVRPLRAMERIWPVQARQSIASITARVGEANGRLNDHAALRHIADLVTRHHLDVVRNALARWNMTPDQVDCVGFHGQTIFHAPADQITLQIGHGGELAAELGCPVVHDFRSADVAAGGEGAPLIPIYHRAVMRRLDRQEPVAVVNIGGVSNISYIEGDMLIGFDSGPGNGPIDSWVAARGQGNFDMDGALASAGTINKNLLERWLDNEYFDLAPPKSLDRFAFSFAGLDQLSGPDGAATLTAFTAETIARALTLCPNVPSELVVTGGGLKNPVLMKELAARARVPVTGLEAYGWSADSLEAEGFGYLAVRRLRELPATFPGTTGVSVPMLAGEIALP